MILSAVFFLSLASLSFEILLVRVFSVSQWNHLSFMVISITLFGFAAGGTFLNIIDLRKKEWTKHLAASGPVHFFIVLYALSTTVSFIVLNRIPLDYFRLPLEPVQALYLMAAYLLLSLPFFFTGIIVSLAYASLPEKTGRVYFGSMIGSAFGAIIPFALLPFIHEGKLIILSAVLPLTVILFNSTHHGRRMDRDKNIFFIKPRFIKLLSLGMVIISGILITSHGSTLIRVNPSPYKHLSQILQYPRTQITETINGIRGRFERIESPHIRFAPGLSLKYEGELPVQTAVFKDGDNPLFLYRLRSPKDADFAKFTLSYSGYLLSSHPKHILVIQHGGGSGIPCAMASGAKNITVVEQHPEIAQLVRHHYDLPVVNQNPRTFMAQSQQRYDIIHIENWGASLPGSSALTQDYLFSLESFSQYYRLLSKNGVIVISRMLLLPPGDMIRLWATAYESLRNLEIDNPDQHIAVLRNWNVFTLIVSANALGDTTVLQDAARNLNFDMVYLPGGSDENVNRFNVFDAPHHHIEIRRLLKAYRSNTEKTYFENYPMDVSLQTDNRPFPYRFLKWSRLKALYEITGSRFYSLFMSGEVVVAIVFVEAFCISVLLLIVPFFTILKETRNLYFSHILYFLALGAGFMFVELFLIKEYIFIFGDPVISLTVVLTGLLVFSGFGGLMSQRIPPQHLRYVIAVLIGVLILMFFTFHSMLHQILGFSKMTRCVLALILLAPPGFLMGLPFPLGMQHLLNLPSQRAYAWTANGCASVLASIASAQIALGFGISVILIFAISAYVLAFCISHFKVTGQI